MLSEPLGAGGGLHGPGPGRHLGYHRARTERRSRRAAADRWPIGSVRPLPTSVPERAVGGIAPRVPQPGSGHRRGRSEAQRADKADRIVLACDHCPRTRPSKRLPPGRPWLARSPRPSAPSRQPSAPPSLRPSSPSATVSDRDRLRDFATGRP